MADKTFPSRFGTESTEFDLFLKLYAGEVLTAFGLTNVMRPLLRERTITQGKSAQFPVIGAATAAYHVMGEDLLRETGASAGVSKYLSDIPTSEKVLHIDFPLISTVMIQEFDELLGHFEVRREYARQQGEELARQWDLHLMQVVFNGSEKAATFSSNGGSFGKGGIQIVDAFDTTAATIKSVMQEAAQSLTENDVPDDGNRYFIIDPAAYYKLASDSEVTSADFRGPVPNSMIEGRVLRYMGFDIFHSNRLAQLRGLGDNTTGAVVTGQRGTDYTGDFTDCKALFFHRMGAGTVRRMGIEMQSEYRLEFQAQAMLAKYAVGHGVLHEAACGSVVTTT